MRFFLSDPEEILVEFVAAQARVGKIRPPEPDDGFIWPQKGKSGLSAGKASSHEERRAKRVETVTRYEKKRRAADPAYAERQRLKKNERVRAWRERQRAKKSKAPPVCSHCGKTFKTHQSLGIHLGWLRRGRA